MHRSLSLIAGLGLAAIAFAPLSASAATTSVPALAAPDASSTQLAHYPWWRSDDRGWHRERHYRRHSYARYCERLRRACAYKYERGEVGQGNCRRYRNECGRRYY
jgi:hypothetical protein